MIFEKIKAKRINIEIFMDYFMDNFNSLLIM